MSDLIKAELLLAGILFFILLILYFLQGKWRKLFKPLNLNRAPANPVLSPNPKNDWENQAVFNPAAILDDEGKVHLLYRAIGGDGVSKIGHAESADGRSFQRTTGYPVYTPVLGSVASLSFGPRVYNPQIYASGGSWGGAEDPRAVRIEDRVYMNYTAFEGWHSVRIALTSIGVEDLKKKRWAWKNPIHISPPGEVHKNWVLFPEKVNGHFVILHRISPEIELEYVDNLEKFQGERYHIKSKTPWGPVQPDEKLSGRWDYSMRGAAAPPIRTERGWLLLYHANNDNRYNLGAMLLDLKDPTKVLYRSPSPLLEPEMHYENDWKPGVIYASGAVVLGDDLHVYYGGGDKYICAAHANLNELLDWLAVYGKI